MTSWEWEQNARNLLSRTHWNINFENVEMPGPSYTYIENNLIDDIKYKVSYTSGPPGSPTEMNPLNESALSARKTEIRIVRDNIANIMSKKIKLV